MKIQEIEFSRLIPADYNPRVALTPDMPEFERLKNSIETFGNVEPIVWNERTGHIVGGHQRLAVLQHLGYTSAEDIFATGYSDGELKTLFGGEDEGPTDLYQDDPEPEEDDSGDDTEEDDGEFSIYLSFPTRQAAEEWLEGEGIERGFPRGGRNLVIHMEGDSYEDTRN